MPEQHRWVCNYPSARTGWIEEVDGQFRGWVEPATDGRLTTWQADIVAADTLEETQQRVDHEAHATGIWRSVPGDEQ